MKKNITKLLVVTIFIISPVYLFARASLIKEDWLGQWNMNHDGFNGKLIISDSRLNCTNTVWCSMNIHYINNEGRTISGTIEKIDDHWQHMVFYLNFPGNRQKFDAYLFSWDNQTIAGTTYWGGRTFGFYATKKQNLNTPNLTPANANKKDSVISKKILKGDTVEIKYSGGTTKWSTSSGFTIKYPNGNIQRAVFVQVPTYVPPTAISDQNIMKWMNNLQSTLLDMIKEEVLNDQSSITNI